MIVVCFHELLDLRSNPGGKSQGLGRHKEKVHPDSKWKYFEQITTFYIPLFPWQVPSQGPEFLKLDCLPDELSFQGTSSMFQPKLKSIDDKLDILEQRAKECVKEKGIGTEKESRIVCWRKKRVEYGNIASKRQWEPLYVADDKWVKR